MRRIGAFRSENPLRKPEKRRSGLPLSERAWGYSPTRCRRPARRFSWSWNGLLRGFSARNAPIRLRRIPMRITP